MHHKSVRDITIIMSGDKGLFRSQVEDGDQAGGGKNYKLLSERAAAERASSFLYNWEPRSDVWSLVYGGVLPVALAGLPGMLLTNRIRSLHKVRLGQGKMIAAAPASVFPATMAVGIQQLSATDIMLGKTQCPVCLEVRTISLQLLSGVVFPSALALLGNFVYLKSFRAVRGLPDILSKGQLKWMGETLYKCRGIVMWSAFAQAVSISGLLWLQRRQWLDVNQKLSKRLGQKDAVSEEKKKKSTLITDYQE